jgi:aminoglycoside 6'-N-acetyltransferase I
MTASGTSKFAIMALSIEDGARIDEVARLMLESFRELSPTWLQTLEAAQESVVGCLGPGMIARVLVVDDQVVGWVGIRHDYGSVWELHPLVVAAGFRGRGFARALVREVEVLAGARGGLTMLLGTSDEARRTSLSDRDLFVDPLDALKNVVVTGAHPLPFWIAVGYTVVGVVPDAEGSGKPTILLAKRLDAASNQGPRG